MARGTLSFPEIPVHAYANPIGDEDTRLGADRLRAMLRHMLVIRRFEEMLAAFKSSGSHEGMAHAYKGPAHLSIGQEAAAVGAAQALAADDRIFGSHRSHGEFLAKGLAAIHVLPADDVTRRFESFRDGALLDVGCRSAHGRDASATAETALLFSLLADVFARDRLFNAPISEAAIVATAVGYAMSGGRALVELMYGDFVGRAGDEIFNQMSKWQAMSAGELHLPVVLRLSIGSKYDAQHSQDWSAMLAHVPGLKVIYPATPRDAKGMMTTAMASNEPVMVLESQRLYDTGELFHPDGVPAGGFALPFGVPEVKRPGRDATFLTIGPSLYPAMTAAGELAERGSRSR